jgi:hypothetical protein
MGTVVIPHGESGWGVKLTTYLNLILRIRMNGVVPLIFLLACMDETGTTVPIIIIIIIIIVVVVAVVVNYTAQEDCTLT